MWKKVESIYITMGKNTFLKQRNKKMIQNYVQFLKTFLAASLLKYLFFKYVSFLNLFQYWTNVCFKFISLARDSGMFYDGNHTYLIEPDENYTSDVSRTSGSPAVIFFFVEYRHSLVQIRHKTHSSHYQLINSVPESS